MARRDCDPILVSKNKSRAIFIDRENKEEIKEFLYRSDKHKKKFEYIATLILSNIKNTDVYDKEDINDKCKDVTAMKFFKGGSNDRIYCKEVRSGEGCFVIIMAILHEKKKSQKNKSRENSKIEAIAGYDYSPKLKK